MAHFAEIDKNGIVLRVIVAEQDFIDTGLVGDPANWIQTSYNTDEGVHKEGGTPLRKNYAGKGYKYDADRDAFIPPRYYPSWVLDEEKCVYVAPVEKPKDVGHSEWNEAAGKWIDAEGVIIPPKEK